MSITVQVGTIIQVADYPGFWKVVGEQGSLKFFSGIVTGYNVVKCSRHGKEFKESNLFRKDFIDREINKRLGKVCYCGFAPGDEKANLEKRLKSGKRKRRIQHLKAKITAMTKELEKLESEEQDAGN